MSKKTETKKLPAYRIFSVFNDGDKAVWQEIGSAWANKAAGLNLHFKAQALPGADIVLLPPKQVQA